MKEYEGHGGGKIPESGSAIFGGFVEFEEVVPEELVLIGLHGYCDILCVNIYKKFIRRIVKYAVLM